MCGAPSADQSECCNNRSISVTLTYSVIIIIMTYRIASYYEADLNL